MIGVFDSGYGGLTIAKPLIEKFKEYDLVYFGDNVRAPYGSRSQDEIFKYTKEAVDWLLRAGCELVIIACNTASSQTLRKIQQESLPDSKYSSRRVLGVLIPLAEVVAKLDGEIGILATEATVKSEAYPREILKLNPDAKIIQVAASLLAPLIEAGKINSQETKEAIKNYLKVFKDREIKNIILGCTHYPFVKDLIQEEMPEAKIFDSPSVIPPSLENYLLRHPEIEKLLMRNGTRRFFTTGEPKKFSKFARDFLHIEIAPERVRL